MHEQRLISRISSYSIGKPFEALEAMAGSSLGVYTPLGFFGGDKRIDLAKAF